MYFLGRYRGCTSTWKFPVYKKLNVFVDLTLYYNDYDDFIGKNLLLCPSNKK